MKTVLLSILAFMTLSISSSFTGCKVTKPSPAHYQNKHPVKELYLSSIAAFNEGELELFLANFSPNIKMYGTDGTYFGATELRKRFEALFIRFPKMRMEILNLEAEGLSDEVVLVNFEWKLFPMGQGSAFSGIGSGIYKKIDGAWMEVLEVETVTHVDEALKQKP